MTKYKTIEELNLKEIDRGDTIFIYYEGKKATKIINGIYQGTRVIDKELKLTLTNNGHSREYAVKNIKQILSTKQALHFLINEGIEINNSKAPLEQRAVGL